MNRSRSTRRPSIRATRTTQPGRVQLVADDGDAAEHRHDEPADGLVGRPVRAPRRRAGRGPGPVARGPGSSQDPSAIWFQSDCDRSCSSLTSPTISSTTSSRVDHAGGPAVLVDDHHHLQAGRAQLQEQRVEPDGLGHHHRRHHQRADGDVRPPVVRDGDGLLDVDQPVDVVPVVADHGEPRVPGLPRQPDHVVGPGRALDARAADPRGHHVGRGPVAEVERAGEQPGGVGLEGPLLGGPPDQARQLLRGAGAGQLLLPA